MASCHSIAEQTVNIDERSRLIKADSHLWSAHAPEGTGPGFEGYEDQSFRSILQLGTQTSAGPPKIFTVI